MGRASISIAITSNFNSRGIDSAIAAAERLAVAAVHNQGKFGKAAVDMGASMGQAGARLVAMGKSVAALGDKLTMGVTVPMGLAAAAAITSATKIDTAWYNVRKTVDMTEDGYRRLKEGAIELSNTQPVSAETILNIEALGGQLGITNGNLESFAKVISGLEISTNLDFETASSSLAQFRNITQMSEDELDNFGSALVDLGNHTATTEADIMNLALRFASAGHVAGMSNQDILGLSAALAGLGMKADAGGSALSQVINRISLDVAKGGEDVQKWADLVGEAPEKFAEAWRTAPTDQFVKVLQAIAADGADANEILNDLGITQIRQSDAMRRLASSGDLVTDSIKRANQAWSENTALDREVSNRNESIAAQFETLKNRITNTAAAFGEPIARMTLAALDGINPLIEGLQNLGNAFANADPGVQQFAFNLAGVAMATGPVLSVTGRAMQAFGNMGQRVGRVSQQWGVYQEALKTTDVSMLNTLSNNKSFAAQFGASRNEIVKAAGGIDRYNVAYAKTTEAIRDRIRRNIEGNAYQKAYNEAMETGTKTESEAVVAANKYVASRQVQGAITKRTKAEIDNLNRSIDSSNVKTLLNTDAITEQEVAASKASRTFGSMGDAVKGALAGFAGMAAIGLAVAGITAFATECQRAAEYSQTLTDATVGLDDAVRTSGIHLDSQAESVKGLAEAHGNAVARAEQALQSQAQLGEQIRQTDADANAQIGTLNRAWDTISSFANQSGLGAAEQYRLKEAVDTVNEACGTQYSVIDASRGIIADENGVVQESTQAIYDNIEARKQQIKLEAQMKDLEALYAQQAEDEAALRDLYSQNTDVIDKYNGRREEMLDIEQRLSKLDPGTKKYKELSEQYSNLLRDVPEVVKKYWDMENALESVNGDIEITTNKIDAQASAVSDLGSSLQQWVNGNSTFQEWFADAEGGVEGFARAVEDAGLTKDMLNDIATNHREVLENLAKDYDGTSESIVRSLEKTAAGRSYLDQIDQGLGNIISRMREVPKFNEAFFGLDTTLDQFAEACERAGLNFDALNALSGDQLKQLAENFNGSIGSIVSGLEGLGDQGKGILDNLAANWRGSFDTATQGAIDSVSSMTGVTTAQLMALAMDFGVAGDEAVRTFSEAIASGMDTTAAAALAKDVTEQLHRALSPEEARAAADAYRAAIEDGLSETDAIQAAIDAIRSTLSGANFSDAAKGKGTEYFAALGADLQQGALDASTVFSDTGRAVGRVLPDGTIQGINEGAVNVPNAVQGMVDGAKPGLDSLAPYAQQSGMDAGLGFDTGLSTGGQGTATTALGMIATLMGILTGGVGQAEGVGSDTGTSYGNAVGNQGGTAENAAMQTLGRLLMIWLTGIAAAQQAGAQTGQAYSQGLSSASMPGVQAVQQAVTTIVSLMQAGIGPATAAGQQMGTGFGQSLSQMLLNAAKFTQAAMASILAAMRAGISPATAAGRQVGTGFATALRSSAMTAVSSAASISSATGSAFGSGRGAAAAAGSALGAAFANAVRASGQAAVGYAQSIRSQVQSIFDSIPTTKTVTVNVKTNVSGAAKASALPSGSPLFQLGPGGTVTPFAGASRAAATAERAAMRIRAARETAASGTTVRGATLTAASRPTVAAIDYDAMYRVVRGAMVEAMREAPPVSASIDGHRLMEYVDEGLARRGRMY